MNGRRWSVLSSKGQLSTARLLPRASICVWSAVWVGSSAESAMANLEPNRSGSANNVSMTSSWHTYSSSHNFVRPPSPAPILTGQAKLCEEGNLHLLPLFRRFSGFFLSTRTTERVEHGVIRLVAAVLEQLIAGFLHNRKSNLPGSGIDLRIVNRHFVLDCVGVHACETFHQPKGVARGNTIAVPPDTGLVVEEIRCLDHQRVAFPMPSRVTQIIPDVRSGVRFVQWNDTRFVELLMNECDVSRRLQNLSPIVVGG